MVKIKHFLIACSLLVLYGISYGQAGMTVAAGTDVTVVAGTTLDIGSGNLLLKDGLSTSPSFLEKGSLTFSGGGEAFIEQYIGQDAWHIVSPSVSNEVNGAYMWMYMYSYTEPNNSWFSMSDPATIPLNAGQGYFLWSYTTDPNGTFPPSPDSAVLNGILNKADFGLTLSNTDASPKSGWNLIGNPYPCAIDWNNNWTSTNVGPTVYLYDNAGTGNYQTWNHNTGVGTNGKTDGNIASGQGFWVRAADTTGAATSITIPQAERLHSTQAFLKNTWENLLRLNVAGDNGSDETVICFDQGATAGFDVELDAWHVPGRDGAPSVYSVQGNQHLAVNFLTSLEINPLVPLDFIALAPGSFIITATGMGSFPADVPLWLEDTRDDVFQDLRVNESYAFASSPLDAAGRFVLHFSNPLGIDNPNNFDMVRIFAYENKVYVNIQGQPDNGSHCTIFDMMGRKVVKRAVEQGLTTIAVPDRGYYLVTVLTHRGMTTEKVFIK
ncbi:MAG: T9SS type A sorting domain-containing protein [Chlorobi bacterium]|nr:T9SS type A sorting domain-containing protein [Chlorobiota bacterium]